MKTIIKIFICLSLIYTPMFANAANVGGWNLSNPVARGASAVYDATKNVVINGKDFVKDSWVKITPNASQVAKVLRGGVAGVALSIAVEQLIGADYSWWLEGDSVKYKVPVPPEAYPKCYSNSAIGCFGSTALAASAALIYDNTLYPTYESTKTTKKVSSNTLTVTLYNKDSLITNIYTFAYVVNPAYDPEANKEEQIKSIPLVTVAQKVISNAESGDQNAKVATTAAAADVVAEAENDDAKARPIANQAEANAETKPADADAAANANTGAATATPQADPVTGEQAPPTDISLEFPVFCNWAPTICEAAQVVISFPQTLTGWWESANQRADEWETSISQAYHDFMRDDELPNDDTKVDITEHPVPELKEDAISWVSSCPADEYVPISLQGVTSTLVLSWSPWCQLLSIIKPAIIASAYIGAAFIVLGIRT